MNGTVTIFYSCRINGLGITVLLFQEGIICTACVVAPLHDGITMISDPMHINSNRTHGYY